jgi:hypothetical protein
MIFVFDSNNSNVRRSVYARRVFGAAPAGRGDSRVPGVHGLACACVHTLTPATPHRNFRFVSKSIEAGPSALHCLSRLAGRLFMPARGAELGVVFDGRGVYSTRLGDCD